MGEEINKAERFGTAGIQRYENEAQRIKQKQNKQNNNNKRVGWGDKACDCTKFKDIKMKQNKHKDIKMKQNKQQQQRGGGGG